VGGRLTGEARVVEGEEELAGGRRRSRGGRVVPVRVQVRLDQNERFGVAGESITSGGRGQWAGAAQSPCF
jgi:hypothetical protein